MCIVTIAFDSLSSRSCAIIIIMGFIFYLPYVGRVYVGDWHNITALDIYYEECNGDNIMTDSGQKRCLKSYPNAHVLTYWTHSWSKRRRKE